MSITNRRDKILEIINKTEVNTQDELAKLLQVEGYLVTQATVSRDIKELGLIKVKGKVLKFRYAQPQKSATLGYSDKITPLFDAFIVSVVCAKNLVVVKTLEGHASACGMAVDKLSINEIVGSVAGDDTLLIVTDSDENAKKVENIIKGYVNL